MSLQKSQTGVAEWEEPRHSGQLMGATLAHFLPPRNTTSHFSVRSTRTGRWRTLFLAL